MITPTNADQVLKMVQENFLASLKLHKCLLNQSNLDRDDIKNAIKTMQDESKKYMDFLFLNFSMRQIQQSSKRMILLKILLRFLLPGLARWKMRWPFRLSIKILSSPVRMSKSTFSSSYFKLLHPLQPLMIIKRGRRVQQSLSLLFQSQLLQLKFKCLLMRGSLCYKLRGCQYLFNQTQLLQN